MTNKKEIFRKAKALLLAGTMSATLSGCNVNVSEDLLEKLGVEVTIETDEDGKVKSGNITSKDTDVTTSVTTQSTEAISYSTTATTTVPIVSTIIEQNPVTVREESIVTDSTEVSEVKETTTTTVTEPVCSQKIDFGRICMDSSLSFGNFKVVDEEHEFKLNDEYPTPWSLAVKYHPSNESAMQFLERIKKINNIEDDKYPSSLMIPVRSIYYIGKGNLWNVKYHADVEVEDVCKMNNVEYYNGIEYYYSDQPYDLLVKMLPEGTLSFERTDGLTTYIKGNALIPSEDIIESNRTYGDEYPYAFFEFFKETDYQGPCFFTRVCEDGEYTRHFVGYNVERVYFLDDVPVMEARDEMTSYMYSLATGQDESFYTTAATVMDPNAYYFYKDLTGKVCFTFDSTDLTKYGYVRADELREKYVKYPEAYMQSPEQFETESKNM